MDNTKNQRLQETLEILKAVQDSTSVANLVTDADFKFVSFNRRLKEFISKNWHKDVEIGDLATSYIHPDNLDAFRKEFALALKGKIVKSEHTYLAERDRRVWFEVEYFPVSIGETEEPHVAFSFKNVTRRKTNENHIKAQNKKLKEIAFLEAHELRGPVSSLLGLINLMKTDHQGLKNQSLYLNKLDLVSKKVDTAIKTIIRKNEEIL